MTSSSSLSFKELEITFVSCVRFQVFSCRAIWGRSIALPTACLFLLLGIFGQRDICKKASSYLVSGFLLLAFHLLKGYFMSHSSTLKSGLLPNVCLLIRYLQIFVVTEKVIKHAE